MLAYIKRLKNSYVGYIKIEINNEKTISKVARYNKSLVSYIGWTGHGNLGDEILFKAHQALFPRLTFVPFRKYTKAEMLRKLQNKQLYTAGFLGGGTLINQSSVWLHKIAYLRSRNLPIYCFGTGVTENDFRVDFGKNNIEEWTKVLNSFKFIGVRGPQSLELLKNAGVTNALLVGDTALSLAKDNVEPRINNKIIGLNFGLINETQIWGSSKSYEQNITSAIKLLIKKGYDIHLLPAWHKDVENNVRLSKLLMTLSAP